MSFSLKLAVPADPAAVGWGGQVETAVEEIHSLVAASCEILQYTESRFLVSGFGEDEWPTDVWTLCCVVEDLPFLLAELRAGSPCTMSFASQTTEREVRLVPDGPVVTMTCKSWSSTWAPNPTVETLDRAALERMLMNLGQQFAELMARVDTDLAAIEPLPSWRAGQL